MYFIQDFASVFSLLNKFSLGTEMEYIRLLNNIIIAEGITY